MNVNLGGADRLGSAVTGVVFDRANDMADYLSYGVRYRVIYTMNKEYPIDVLILAGDKSGKSNSVRFFEQVDSHFILLWVKSLKNG